MNNKITHQKYLNQVHELYATLNLDCETDVLKPPYTDKNPICRISSVDYGNFEIVPIRHHISDAWYLGFRAIGAEDFFFFTLVGYSNNRFQWVAKSIEPRTRKVDEVLIEDLMRNHNGMSTKFRPPQQFSEGTLSNPHTNKRVFENRFKMYSNPISTRISRGNTTNILGRIRKIFT